MNDDPELKIGHFFLPFLFNNWSEAGNVDSNMSISSENLP